MGMQFGICLYYNFANMLMQKCFPKCLYKTGFTSLLQKIGNCCKYIKL